MKLIFAQGNPDQKYLQTRHNTGFLTIEAFAESHDALWKDVDKFKARIAELTLNDQKVLLVEPQSFYNDTGLVARQLLDFYKINAETDLLVIHDDLALPLGTIRVRHSGGDAGNNGIKSLNSHIDGVYTRIRIGIWTTLRDQMDDIDFVLGKFPKDEMKKLEKHIIPQAVEMIEDYLAGKLEATSTSVQ